MLWLGHPVLQLEPNLAKNVMFNMDAKSLKISDV